MGTLAALSEQSSGSGAFMVQAAQDHFDKSRVELFQKGRKVADTGVAPTGRWNISNLLPGKYSVRAFNGLEYTDFQEVQLQEGAEQEVQFVFDPLPTDKVFAFPNPALHGTTFRFESALPGLEAQVMIFDIAGILVREIAGSEMQSPAPGRYHAPWDLSNMKGEPVASGVYLFVVKVKGSNGQSGKVVKKLAVVR
ncbi:MAG TPA: hypothetical protein DD417_20455 [Elusimicrobia bacterium]|nr:hypothetical protein [Elusimicrobiota bacterium]